MTTDRVRATRPKTVPLTSFLLASFLYVNLKQKQYSKTMLAIYRISSYSFRPWIAFAAKIQFIKLKYCGNYLNWQQFPNSKKNSFRGNYMRQYGIWFPFWKQNWGNLLYKNSCNLETFGYVIKLNICKLEIPYLLIVFLSIPLNKLPWLRCMTAFAFCRSLPCRRPLSPVAGVGALHTM